MMIEQPFETVTLSHPDLPGQPITVAAESVEHYTRSGWRQVVDKHEPKKEN